MINIDDIAAETPILIAGPTASGKSALALRLSAGKRQIVNADALQVFADWRVLTARPSPHEEAQAPHALYGHVGWTRAYSTGDWLRDVADLVPTRPAPIIVGGTGLYFRALTEGLADIPATPPEIRAEATARLDAVGLDALGRELDPDVRADMDLQNPMRVLRAWEVKRATGRSIRAWQAETPAPLISLEQAAAFVLNAPVDWLNDRIARRFDLMIEQGALEEAQAVLPRWDPKLNAAQAIGGPELVAHLREEMTLAEAREKAITASKQYAKRQRTWFRSRMREWRGIDASTL